MMHEASMGLQGHSCGSGLQHRAAAHASCSSRALPAAHRQPAQRRVARRQRQQCQAVRRDTNLWTPDQPGDVYAHEEDEFEEELETPTEYKGLSREQIGLMGLQPGLNRLGKEPDPV